jgi:hypothetical protein
VTTTGAIRGATVAAGPPAVTPGRPPLEGAGLVTLLVVAAAAVLEGTRSWRRRSLPSG